MQAGFLLFKFKFSGPLSLMTTELPDNLHKKRDKPLAQIDITDKYTENMNKTLTIRQHESIFIHR